MSPAESIPALMSAPGASLRTAVDGLSVAARQIRAAREAFRAPAEPLAKLKAATAVVAAPRRMRQPVDSGEALRRWRIARASGRTESLTRRDLRQLAWEPEAVFDEVFQGVLERSWAGGPISSRTMQALVRSFHRGWTPVAENERTARWLRLVLRRNVRESEIIKRWRQETPVVLGPDGRNALALKVLADDRPVAAVAATWGVDDGTPYFTAAIKDRAISWAVNPTFRGEGLKRLFEHLLPWARLKLPAEQFKEAAAEVILDNRFQAEGVDQNVLKAYVLGPSGLGDPRLPANRHQWTGVKDEARARILHWLTKADIVMFFETILPDAMDRHGRKPFWLKYVPLIIESRPLLTASDRSRLGRHFRGREDELRHVGSVWKNESSAFFLVFPEVLVVEFAVAGCAYFYTGRPRQILQQAMWRGEPFSVAELKSTSSASEYVPHSQGWEPRMEDVLARLGVRRTGRARYY